MPTNDIFYQPWAPKTIKAIEAGPCGHHCDAALSFENVEGFSVWNCRHGAWVMPIQRETTSEEGHSMAECGGFCREHPLMNAYVLSGRDRDDTGLSWGDQLEIDLRAARAAETPAQTAARLVKEAEAAAASLAGIIRYSTNKKADKWCAGGAMKFRVPRPCKYQSLFLARTCAACGTQVPEGQTNCQGDKGHGRVCGELLAGCWSHEKSHNCIYIHPDEPQWADALSGVLCYDRERQVFFKKGEAAPAAAGGGAPLGGAPSAAARFAALSGDKRPRDGGHPRDGGGGGYAGGGAPRAHGGGGGYRARN